MLHNTKKLIKTPSRINNRLIEFDLFIIDEGVMENMYLIKLPCIILPKINAIEDAKNCNGYNTNFKNISVIENG